ncbi:MAG: hypothetical protein FJ255_00170 [Phycisphaerae bacterium]|nr:hypothetical protein [Phycisphaerae bacterium]
MSLSKVLVVLAGAAAGLASSAAAQTSESQAYRAELLADAANRTSLLAAGGAGRDDKGFYITDGGAYKLYIKGYSIFRYTANFRSKREGTETDPEPDATRITDQDNFTHGFTNRVTKLGVEGTLWDPNFYFKIRGAFSNGGSRVIEIEDPADPDATLASFRSGTDGAFSLDDAFLKYSWENGFFMQGGQFTVPLLRERNVEEQFQLATERSVTTAYFQPGRAQGIALGYGGDQFRFVAGFTDGWRSQNTDFNDSREADWGLTARAEFKGAGEWGQFSDFTNWRDANQGWLLGAGVHYQQSGDTGDGIDHENSSSMGTDVFMYSIDASYEGAGWNLFGSFTGVNVDSDVEGSASVDDFGAVIHGGVFVTDQVELFGRWDALFIDSDFLSGGDPDVDIDSDFHFGTLGMNYYISPKSHAAKIQADLTWSFNKTDAIKASPILGSPLGTNVAQLGQRKSGEIGFRVQAVVVF